MQLNKHYTFLLLSFLFFNCKSKEIKPAIDESSDKIEKVLPKQEIEVNEVPKPTYNLLNRKDPVSADNGIWNTEKTKLSSLPDLKKCVYKKLSDSFNIYTYFYHDTSTYDEANLIEIDIRNKADQNIYFIRFGIESSELYEVNYRECGRGSSFTKNIFCEDFGGDNYYGDIIVCDVNFDGLEDLAVCRNTDNSGSRYNYYLQSEGKWKYNEFLSTTMELFPKKINKEAKTLTTNTHCGVATICTRTIKYDSETQSFSKGKDKTITIGKK